MLLSAISQNTLLTVVIIIAALTFILNVYTVRKLLEQKKGTTALEKVMAVETAASAPVIEDNGAVVAAITAAIAAVLDGEAKVNHLPRAGFIVKSIKKA